MTQCSSHDFQIINEAYGSMYGVDEAINPFVAARALGKLSGKALGVAKKVLPQTGKFVKAAANKVVKYGSPLALGYALAGGGSVGDDAKNAKQNAEQGGGLTDASTVEDIQKEIANVDKFIAEIDKKKEELLKYKETLNAMLQKKSGGDKQQQQDAAQGEEGVGDKVASGIGNVVGGLADGAGSVLKGVGQGAGNIVGGVASGIGNVVGGLGKAFGLGS